MQRRRLEAHYKRDRIALQRDFPASDAPTLRDARNVVPRLNSVLRLERIPCHPERTSFGVPADRPCLAGVHHAPTERLDALQRLGDIAHREVGQREGIAGAASAGMDADRGGSGVRLPTLSLSILASLQPGAEKGLPKTSGALRIVCRELDQ